MLMPMMEDSASGVSMTRSGYFALQPIGHAKDAAGLHILADDEDAVVGAHGLVERLADRLEDGHGGHHRASL